MSDADGALHHALGRALKLEAEIRHLRELAYAPDGKEHRSMVFEEAAKRVSLEVENERLRAKIEEMATCCSAQDVCVECRCHPKAITQQSAALAGDPK